MRSFDCVIVGGGPAGMTAALYMLRSGAKTLMVEKLSYGGQILMTEVIENYPGFPKGIKGWELADVFAAHLAEFPLERINDAVLRLEPQGKRWLVTAGDEVVEAKCVVVCSGARYKRLGVPGEKEFIGRGVSYCALCDGNFFRNRPVAVIGGGNSALEESLYLAKLVSQIYLIHRREDFRACKLYQDKCRIDPKIRILTSTVVEEIVGAENVEGVRVKNLSTGESKVLDVEGVFVFVGFEPQSDFLPEGLELDKSSFIKADSDMRTNLPGLFVAGDARSKTTRQVATAVGDGAAAANAAFSYLEQLE